MKCISECLRLSLHSKCSCDGVCFSTVRAVLLMAVLVCVSCMGGGDCSLLCHCTDCTRTEPGHIWGTCETSGVCYTKVVTDPWSSMGPVIQRGCLTEEMANLMCNLDQSPFVCCHSDRCNGNLIDGKIHLRKLLQNNEETLDTRGMMNNERTIAIITASVCVFLVTVIIALVITIVICCLYFYRGNHRTHARTESDREAGRIYIGNCCSAIIPQSETISSLLMATHSPTNSPPSSSLSLLVQRAIVKNTIIERVIAQGEFYELSLGVWRRERVMVKTYPPKYERMWFSETEIHQIPYMHHPHILTFIGADYLLVHGLLKHYLITEYHDSGSLFDYLSETVLDVGAVVVLAQSAASGLAHLHLEVRGLSMEKPSIVHRNISSRSFFVKNDGTCCLGDLSLAIKDDAHFQAELKGKSLGHTPYLSPELLDPSLFEEGLCVDVLKKSDVYALGLVMWEIARRCYIQGSIENSEVPFTSMLSSDHASIEEMKGIVCTKKLRPPLAEHWNLDETMQSCVKTFTGCWQEDYSLRPSAMTTKNSLDKLLPSIKLISKNHNISTIECQK